MHRLAVVEDNPDNLLLVTLLLEGRYVFDEYADGLTALSGIRASPPDLVLLDVSLPGMDGIEVLRRLRATDSGHLPVIALTAHAMTGDRERFLDAGFDGYVSKPIVDEHLLIAEIERLLARTA